MKKKSKKAVCSGKFTLRISPKLHAELRKHARAENISLNKYIVRILELNLCTDWEPSNEHI